MGINGDNIMKIFIIFNHFDQRRRRQRLITEKKQTEGKKSIQTRVERKGIFFVILYVRMERNFQVHQEEDEVRLVESTSYLLLLIFSSLISSQFDGVGFIGFVVKFR